MYEIEITAEGLRYLNKLLEKVRHAALESVFRPIATPQTGSASRWLANSRVSGRHGVAVTASSTRSSKTTRAF